MAQVREIRARLSNDRSQFGVAEGAEHCGDARNKPDDQRQPDGLRVRQNSRRGNEDAGADNIADDIARGAEKAHAIGSSHLRGPFRTFCGLHLASK